MLASIRRRCPWLPAALLLGAALAIIPAALAGTPSPVYPPKAKVGGVKPADWVGHWFQWNYSTPNASHPILDFTGTYAAIGQRGPVWFLSRGSAEQDVTRTIKVPAGVALFFPLKYSQADNGALLPSAYLPKEDLYLVVKATIDPVDITAFYCKVSLNQGTEVPVTDLAKRRIKSTVFSYGVGPATPPTGFGVTAGTMVNPAVADGYWVMLKPLPVGTHTVKYGLDSGSVNLDWKLTYNITVAAPQE